MNSLKGIIIGLLPIAIALYFGVYLYRAYPTTPTFIMVLLISFCSVLIAFGIFRKFTRGTTEHKETYLNEELSELPALEGGMIYAIVDDFVNKFSREKGELYVAGHLISESKIELVNVSFDKLTDHLILKFTGGISFWVTEVANVGIGDNQFAIFGFDKLELVDKKKISRYRMDKKVIYKLGETELKSNLVRGYPPILFCWE